MNGGSTEEIAQNKGHTEQSFLLQAVTKELKSRRIAQRPAFLCPMYDQ
jgi:hypothetical protein